MKEKLYNILADFALKVDKCHKDGVEPSCKEEIIKITNLFNQGERNYEKNISTRLRRQHKA